MTPSTNNLSSGVAASLVVFTAWCFESGAAYTSPPTVDRHCRRSRVRSAVSSSAASVFDAGDSGSSHNEEEVPKASLSTPPRLGLSPLPYLRIQKRGRHYDVQTAITTFQTSTGSLGVDEQTTTVDLHAQIHFGDASYFQFFNDEEAFDARYDRVLYELITEDKFLASIGKTPALKQLTPARSHGHRRPRGNPNPIAPTQADRATASQYGLQCQVEGIRYCREGWVHADLTREEFLAVLDQAADKGPSLKSDTRNSRRQPLWALASTATTYPGAELVASLARPLATTSNSASAALTRRLFTHLFLPGDAVAGWIRAVLWLGVPSPELSIMLVDWSSLSHIGRQSRRRSDANKDATNSIAPISPIAVPVLLSLITGNWGTARRLVFGQVLVSGQASADTSQQGVLIEKRNERAMAVLRESLSSWDRDAEEDGTRDRREGQRIALLYGAGHCRDLHHRLVREQNMTPVRTEWRTAFRATAPRWGEFANVERWRAKSGGIAAHWPSSLVGGENTVNTMSVSTLESVAVGLVILPLYLLVGALDWVSTLGDVGTSVDGGLYLESLAAVLLYLVRHVALYVSISKFVVDWGGNEGRFDDDERA